MGGALGLPVDRYVALLDPAHIQLGDPGIGSLPSDLAAVI